MPFKKTIPTDIRNLKRLASAVTAMVWEEAKAVQMEVPIWDEAVIIKTSNMEKNKNIPDQSRNTERLEDTIGAGRADQDANADRGGTADLDNITRRTHSTGTGSGISTKRGVTGSDLDGQVADQ